MTSGVNAKGRFGKQDFVYVAADIPLSFRTVGFPQHGWKVGVSDETFPARQSA